MVTQLDNGVGEVADALTRKKMWENTVFIFMRFKRGLMIISISVNLFLFLYLFLVNYCPHITNY